MNGLFTAAAAATACKSDGMTLDPEVWFGDLDGAVD